MKSKALVLLWITGFWSVFHAQPCGQPFITGGAATYCAENNSGFVFVDNRTDSLTITRWESAPNLEGPYNLIAGSENKDTIYFANLMQTTYYKVFLQRKGCEPPTDPPRITVSVDQPTTAGYILGSSSACEVFPSGTLTLTGQRGNVVAWQMQEAGQSEWTPLSSTTTTQPISNITQNTNFRAIVKNGVCPEEASDIANITIYPDPVADFQFDPVCLGDTVKFYEDCAIASGSITNYAWTMGDGSSASGRYPTRRYFQAGTYLVTLTATTDHGCRNDIIKDVEVYHLPVADFSAAEVCLHDSTVFQNLSTSASGEIVYCNWNFLDLTTSSETAPKHLFAQAGERPVDLFVRTEYGCSHSIRKSVRVNENPIAEFEADTVCLGNATNFDNLSTVESGYIYRNQWSFGDGTSSQLPYPNKSYQTAGDFSVRLIVESEKQCKDTVTQWVHVRALPIADFSVDEVCDGETTTFHNLSTAPEDSIVRHQWNFGDGSASSDSAPSKLYLNPEVYTVTLSVRSLNGCEHQVQKHAIVHRNPIADFSVQNVCIGDRAEFINLSFIRSGESLHHQWDLGDGNQSQFSDFYHLYEFSGNYTISLKVTSFDGGCVDSTQRSLHIYALPHINAGEDVTTGRGIPIQLAATGGVQYHWFPTTGLNNSASPTPTATLSAEQTYVVYGTDAYGCENTDTITVFVIDDQRVVPTNFISPNSGGNNDYWVIQNIENYPEAKIVIFDIHGRPVYTIPNNYQNNWDGRNQNGETLPDGTYYYVITFPKDNRTYKGAILILRKR